MPRGIVKTMSLIDGKTLLRKTLGVFLLLITVGLATCQSVVNSFTSAGVAPVETSVRISTG